MAYTEIEVRFRTRHKRQLEIKRMKAMRKVIRAGRRGGKTVEAAIDDVEDFIFNNWRCLYGVPTSDQLDKYWEEVCWMLNPLIKAGFLKKNETEHTIKWVNPSESQREARIKAKTCWNADTLRGGWAHKLTLDEFQLMSEDTFIRVGAPMLLDKNGIAKFIYTPPSLYSKGVSKALDPRHAAKLFKRAMLDTTGRWGAITYPSHDNPHLSIEALDEIVSDMSDEAYRQEVLAEDDDLMDSWMVFRAFNHDTQVIPRYEIPLTFPRWMGHDFGTANPAALLIAQDPATGIFIIEEEYFPGGKDPDVHVKAWQEMTKGMSVMARVGGNQTTEVETREAYRMHGWWIQAPKIKEPGAQIDRVRALFELNKVFIFDDLQGLRSELNNCLWDINEDGTASDKIKNSNRFHRIDCLKSIATFWRPETVRHNQGIVVMSGFSPYAR